MNEGPLLIDCLLVPLLIGVWVFCSVEVFIHFVGKSIGEFVQYHGVVDIEPRMSYRLLELRDVSVQLFAVTSAKTFARLERWVWFHSTCLVT